MAAAIVLVPLFRKFKMGAILAYLFAGIIVGPGVLALIKDPATMLHLSELGVVFLLFLIGLELAPERLWKLRHAIFGLGLLQVVLTGLVFFYIGQYLGLSTAASYVAGFGLALSSTAFAIQILEEEHQFNTNHGQGAFSILMFQDLAIVPILASLSFFAEMTAPTPSWDGILKAVGVIFLVIIIGRFLIRHVFRLVADSRIQEVFTAMSLFVVIGTALLMESIGLSMGMGAFLAGVLLANSEYRHELESNLMPFKGLLLGLFFMAVGMTLDTDVVLERPHIVLMLTIGFVLLKGLMIFVLGRIFRFPNESARNMAFVLPQGGEFAFVLFSAAVAKGLLDSELSSILSAAVTLSMAATPFLFAFNQKKLRTFSEISERPYDQIESEEPEVIIAGYGRFGQIVARFLRAQNVRFTILEHSAEQVDAARKFGSKIYYGDASRKDILEAAGAASAKIFVLAIDDVEKSAETATLVKNHFPQLQIIARVRNRQHALRLLELGVENVHRETYLTSLEVAKEIMLAKGKPRAIINGQLAKFRTHDEEILRKQLEVRHDEEKFISYTTQANLELQKILQADGENENEV